MIKFNEYVKQIPISECVILVNSYSKEYVALHKDVYFALKEVFQTDCVSLENLVTFMTDRLYTKEDQTEETVTPIKNTIYYLIDNAPKELKNPRAIDYFSNVFGGNT